MKILLIGSLPPPLGGTTLTLDALRTRLQATPGVVLRAIDTGRIRGSGLRALLPLLDLCGAFLRGIFWADVVTLHVATTALPTVGLLAALLCRLQQKPLVLRKFASADYASGSVRARLCAHYAIRLAQSFLVETKALTALSRRRGYTHSLWFPTHRDRQLLPPRQRSKQACRFVFVGQVRDYKGVNELLAAAHMLEASSVSVDIYGPLYAPFTEASFAGRNIRYCGVLSPQEVMAAIAEYDVLIMPTKAHSEGYPGVIVEALQVGVPVIASHCGAIPELTGSDCALLVPPGDVDALSKAMSELHVNTELFSRMSEAAGLRGEGLSTGYWAVQFVAICRALVAGCAPVETLPVVTEPVSGDGGAC